MLARLRVTAGPVEGTPRKPLENLEETQMDRPEIILAPGPTPIPPEVLLAQGSPLVYHRGPGFGRAHARRHRPD